MSLINQLKKIWNKGTLPDRDPAEAYNLWAPGYDHQPENLMMHLDAQVFHRLLERVDIENKIVIDVGCGTGRHWPLLEARNPSQLIGYDISDGMLSELKRKFPDAEIQLATDNRLTGVSSGSADLIVSTLTMAHFPEIEEVMEAWDRVLKPGGGLLITDFHPELLAAGGRRDFSHGNEKVVIRNYVHSVDKIRQHAFRYSLKEVYFEQRLIDEQVKPFYEDQNALHVYDQFKGLPVIYGMQLCKK
jgi:ubiquinone/menaquinone biosynthesis C-methylase UbiE